MFTIFADIDKNSDRRLTRAEVKGMLERLRVEGDLDTIFEAADSNDGGMVSKLLPPSPVCSLVAYSRYCLTNLQLLWRSSPFENKLASTFAARVLVRM